MTSPIGTIEVETDVRGAVTSVLFVEEAEANVGPGGDACQRVICQLEEYFRGQRRQFELELEPEGTAFEQSVWREVRRIPCGATDTYGSVARRLGDPSMARAVGVANSRNPIAIVIPCHRVVGSDGDLTGYAGGLDRKKWLLDMESGQTRLDFCSV
jgi:methylated-DNA-[protein]-cysteine S-methyltransferase